MLEGELITTPGGLGLRRGKTETRTTKRLATYTPDQAAGYFINLFNPKFMTGYYLNGMQSVEATNIPKVMLDAVLHRDYGADFQSVEYLKAELLFFNSTISTGQIPMLTSAPGLVAIMYDSKTRGGPQEEARVMTGIFLVEFWVMKL
jgi:hypothetical protein